MSKSESETPQELQNDSSFLKRWSKRKLEPADKENPEHVDSSVEPAQVLPPTHTVDAELPISLEQDSDSDLVTEPDADEIILSDADMPPIESLDSKSDVSMFLNKGVSDALRKAAFRRLFSLPAYNIRDGLNDYDEDYTYFEPLGDTITSDMKFHAARKERERLAKEAELAEAERLEEEKALEEQQALEEEMNPDQLEDNSDQAAAEESQDESATDDNPVEPAVSEHPAADIEHNDKEFEVEHSTLESDRPSSHQNNDKA